MQEILQQIVSQARGAWRFRWYALLVAWIVAIGGWFVVYSMPNQYQSHTRVYADTDTMLTPLLHGIAIRPNVHQRVRLVATTLLARPNLEKVARETGLNLRSSDPKSTDTLLKNMRSRISIKGGGKEDLYSISYVDKDPKMAQSVVQSLLNVMMSKTLGAPLRNSGVAQKFLQQQLKEYSRRLNAAQQRLAEFKKKHIGLVPGQGGGDYFSRLQGAKQNLTNLKSELEVAQSQRASIQSQLASIKNGTASIAANPRIEAIDAQISSYRKKLNNLLLRYTPQYPDVLALKQMISELQKKRQTIKSGGAPASASQSADMSSNPVYQGMQTELYQTKVKIKTLKSKIGRQNKQIAKLEGKANQVTDLQAKLSSLNRDYSVMKSQYKQLRKRLDKAELTQQASHSGNNLKFRIVEPPVVPLVSSGPPRAVFLAVVLVFSLLIGAAFAVFMHQVRPVFLDRETLRNTIGRPVLGVVSVALSSAERHLWRAEVASFAAGVLLLVIVFGGALVFKGQITDLVQNVFVLQGGLT
jgi:polysaccharide chain length determinant protein (PEP-CTERM system associated)